MSNKLIVSKVIIRPTQDDDVIYNYAIFRPTPPRCWWRRTTREGSITSHFILYEQSARARVCVRACVRHVVCVFV